MVFWEVFCRSLITFVLFLVHVLSIPLRFTASDYHFGIFEYFIVVKMSLYAFRLIWNYTIYESPVKLETYSSFGNLISHDEWVYSFIAVYMEKLLSGNIKYIMNNRLCFNMLWGSLWKRGTRANIRCNSCGVFQVFFTIHVYEKKV